MKYRFKWKSSRSWLWRSKIVVGHRYDKDQDKMILYFEQGQIFEIPEWRLCSVFLGLDWKLAVQAQMEKEAGQSIKLGL